MREIGGVRSGDGFITLADGSVRWGRFGAAGVLVRHRDGEGDWYFLARRSLHCHNGGTWAIPGGACDGHETPIQAAVREFEEEIGVPLDAVDVVHVYEDDHGGWCYWTVVVDVPDRFTVPPQLGWETDDARWVHANEVATLQLFDAFGVTIERLRASGIL
jgi:8-oxo-dGTP pyrophosphatase MutT (NUDIX family)